jgi:small-conductance mechanosensitive channel/CRP-like cAMP-binding protein
MSWSEEVPWLIGLFVAVALTAALVNRVRPKHRPRIRRLVVTFALYAVAIGVSFIFAHIDRPTWASSTATAGQLFQALVLVMLGATLSFSIVLPGVGVELPRIATDLLVGLGSIAATLVILSRNGLDATGALVSGAVVSAVLAISLQSTLGNILGGVALQLDGSIHEGDWIQLDNGKQGRVRAVRWRHTVVETRDFSTIIVPNAQLLGTSITILGKRDGVYVPQRVSVLFNVDFRYAPSRVSRVVTEALQASPMENVAAEPKPAAVCTDLAKDTRESYGVYAARYSIVDLALEDPTSSRVRARIYTALRRAGIPLSVPALVALADTPDDVATKREARDVDERFTVLKTVPLFQSFNEDELRTLAGAMNRASYTVGETITRQGAVAHWLYVLAAGHVEIRTNIDPDGPGGEPDKPVFVAQVAAPNFFGEMSLMTGAPRAADVVAISDVDCFRLGKDAFEKVLLARPEIANELSGRLATRRVELVAARAGLDAQAKHAVHDSERERILRAITKFFGL